MLGVLQSPWNPGDPALEPADPQPGVVVENPGEDVLGELFAESVDVDHHPDHHAVELTRALGWGLADVVGHRKSGGFNFVPYRLPPSAAVVDRPPIVVLAGIQWQKECLEAERLQFSHCPFGSFR